MRIISNIERVSPAEHECDRKSYSNIYIWSRLGSDSTHDLAHNITQLWMDHFQREWEYVLDFITKNMKNNVFLHVFITTCDLVGIRLVDQTIPSGVYSALEDANITGSVLYSYNDVNFRWIARDNWTYTLNFAGNLNL